MVSRRRPLLFLFVWFLLPQVCFRRLISWAPRAAVRSACAHSPQHASRRQHASRSSTQTEAVRKSKRHVGQNEQDDRGLWHFGLTRHTSVSLGRLRSHPAQVQARRRRRRPARNPTRPLAMRPYSYLRSPHLERSPCLEEHSYLELTPLELTSTRSLHSFDRLSRPTFFGQPSGIVGTSLKDGNLPEA